MNERRTSRSPYRVRVHAGSDLPTRHAVTAALMAAFFLVANGLALAWTLTNHNPHMRHGFVVAMIGIATALFPVVQWGLFKLPWPAVQTLVAATTLLAAAAIYGSGETQAPLSFLFLWAIPYTWWRRAWRPTPSLRGCRSWAATWFRATSSRRPCRPTSSPGCCAPTPGGGC
jgi:hypothetical protein